MGLIGLYCLTTLFFFLDKEPFTSAGVLISFCYLPGLFLVSLLKKDKIILEDLMLAFPCSIGISGVLTLVLLFAGVHIEHVAVIIHIITGAGAAIYAVYAYRGKRYAEIYIDKPQLMFCLFALLIILLLNIPFFLGTNRLAISAHAFHHSLLVTQIINGIFPPENPGLGGTIIGYYWGFHALIAALTVKTHFQQIQIMFLLNVLSLYIILGISYSFARAFDLSEKYCYIMALAIIGLMRADAGILFLIKLFSGNLVSLKELTASPVEPFDVLSSWINDPPWIDTRLFFLHKLYNVSGMLLAVSLCYSYLFVLLRRKYYSKRIYMISTVLIISACFFNYPPLAIFLLFFAPLWSCYTFFSINGNIKKKMLEASMVVIPYIIAGLIVSPYMLEVVAGRNISSSGQGELFSFDFYSQSLKNMVTYMVVIPVIVYGVWIAFKKLSLSQEFFFPVTGAALCLFLTIFTRWPFNNSYKFNYILLYFYSLFFVFGFSGLLTFVKTKWLRQLITALTVLLIALTPVVVEASHIISSFSTDYVYTFSGGHIMVAQDKYKNEAYKWIRENTPDDALLMLTYTETNWPCCGLNNNYITAAITERNLYVMRDDDYTVSNPEYTKRVLFRKKLFENPDDQEVIDYFSSFDRPIYLVIEDKLDESRFFVEDIFKSFPNEPGKEFSLVFQNNSHRVYKIQYNR